MKLTTHLAFGLTAYSVASLAVGMPNPYQIGVCLFTSTLPDIDISSSEIVRLFRLRKLSIWIERNYGHRGITHSYLFVLMVGAIFSPLLLFGRWEYPLYAAIGVLSHIASDMLTKDGVRFLWPSRKRDVWFGNKSLLMETGSRGEIALGVVCGIIATGCLIGNVAISWARANIVEVKATVTAVSEIKVKVGDRVKVGNVLAENEHLKVRTKLKMDKARLELEIAKDNLDRLLHPDDVRVKALRLNVSQLEAEVANLKEELKKRVAEFSSNEEKIRRLMREREKGGVGEGEMEGWGKVVERLNKEIEKLRDRNIALGIEALRSKIAEIESQLEQASFELTRLLSPSKTETSQWNSRILASELELKNLALEMESVVVKSPVDGEVRGIKVTSSSGLMNVAFKIWARELGGEEDSNSSLLSRLLPWWFKPGRIGESGRRGEGVSGESRAKGRELEKNRLSSLDSRLSTDLGEGETRESGRVGEKGRKGEEEKDVETAGVRGQESMVGDRRNVIPLLRSGQALSDSEGSVEALQAVPDSRPLVRVTKVIDGDTIEIETGDRIRYIGVNTPEVTRGKVEYLGKEASAFNKELVEGKMVRLEYDVQRLDKYNRVLAYVYLEDGRMVNAEIIKWGYAQVMTIPPNVKYSKVFIELEREARKERRGLWK